MSELLPCYCHGDDPEPYCPRHTPLPGEADTAETVTPQAGIVGAEPDRDDTHTMGHDEMIAP